MAQSKVGGISLPSLLILHKIIRDGPQPLGELAEQLDFTTGAVTAVCDNLEQKKLARRIRGTDRRRIFLDITKEGRELFERHRNIGPCSISLLFDGFTGEMLDQQLAVCRKIIQNLENYSGTLMELTEENERRKTPAESVERLYRLSGRPAGSPSDRHERPGGTFVEGLERLSQ
ncbi:MarR family transcriptional regulator [Lachnospiraceae bacterium 54-53]